MDHIALPAAVLSVLVNANTGGAAANLTRLDRRLKGTAATGEAMGTRVAKGAKFAALGLAAGAAGSVYAAAKFESAFAEVRKTVDANERGFKRIEKGLRGLATQIPVSANELAYLAGEAGALGVKSRDIVKFTKTASMLGTTTNLSSEEAANSLARLANIMDSKDRKAFERMGSTLVDLGNKGASTEDEIASMALRIAGAGKTLGLTEAEVLGLSASLANVGIRAEMGGSAISRVMLQMQEAIAQGGADLAGFAEITGVSAEEFARLFERDAPRAIATFAQGLGKLNKEGKPIISTLKEVQLGERRVGDTLLRIAGNTKQFTEAQNVANKAWGENAALTDEARKRYETFESQLSLLKNSIVETGIGIGQDLLPDLKAMVKILKNPKLTLDEKIERISDRLGGVIEKWAPKVAEAGAHLGLELAKGLGRAFIESNVWGKLLTAGVLIRMLGGRGALLASGAGAGRWLGLGIGAGAAASAAGGAGAGAAGGLAGGLLGKLRNVKWARLGGVGLGLAVADSAIREFQRRSNERSGDLLTELGEKGKRSFLARAAEMATPQIGNADHRDEERMAANLTAQYEEMLNRRVRLSDAAVKSLRAQAKEVDLTKQARAELDRMFTTIRLGRELGIKVNLGMDAAKLNQMLGNFRLLRSGVLTSMRDIGKVTRDNARIIATELPKGSADARAKMAQNFRGASHAIAEAMQNGDISVKRGVDRMRSLLRNAQLLTGEDPLGIAKGFSRSWEKAGGINRRQQQQMIADLGKMPPAARQKAFDAMIAYGQGLAQKKKIPLDDLRNFRSAAVSTFGDLTVKSKASSLDLAIGVAGNFGSMGSAVANVLSILRDNTNNALVKFGAKKLDFAVKTVGSWLGIGGSNKQKKQTGGFIVPGEGSGDKFHTALPPGSFVLNREATRAFGFQQGGLMPVVLEPKERVFLPPEVQAFGQHNLEAANSTVRRFQKGGQLPKPMIAGPAGPLRDMGQGAADKVHGAAKNYIGKQKPKGGVLGSAPGALGAVERLAAAMGLEMTSGFRPGDDGFHGINRARDFSNSGGPTPEMMRFALAVSKRWGKRLLELIYSPLGWSIDNGRKVPPYAVGDHYDHVHVAMQKGGLLQKLAKGGTAKASRSEGPPWEPAFKKRMNHIWRRTAPLLGQAGQEPPPIWFPRGLTRTHGHVAHVDRSSGKPIIGFDQGWAQQLLRGGQYPKQTLLHEWAHAFQKPGLERWESEGGATMFERYASRRLFGQSRDSRWPIGYRKFADAVKAKKDWPWIKRGQFLQQGGAVGSRGGGASASSFRGGSGASLGQQVQGKAQAVWNAAAPHFGRSPQAPMPWLFVEDLRKGVRGTTRVGRGRRHVALDRRVARGFVEGSNRAEKTLLHEWAHVHQRPWNGPKWEREGGAEAFSFLAGDKIYGRAKIPFRHPGISGSYKRFYDSVMTGKSRRWILRGQFGLQRGGRVGLQKGGAVGLQKGGAPSTQKSQKGGWMHGSSKLAPNHLATLAHHVGAQHPGLMGQIAMAESGGNPRAMGAAGDKGLWQIIPSTASAFGIDYGNLFDPLANAQGMKKVLDGQGLSAWSTYNNGAYRSQPKGDVLRSLDAGGSDARSEETVPGVFHGARTGSLSFPSVPKSVRGIERQLNRWRRDLRIYRRAARIAKEEDRPKTQRAIEANVKALENHLRKLRNARTKLRKQIARKRFSSRLGKQLGKITGQEQAIEAAQRGYETASQYAEQLVGLEPTEPILSASATDKQREAAEKTYVQNYSGYVEGRERPAYEAVLGKAATWRNSILTAQQIATNKEKGWETGIRRRRMEMRAIDRYAKNVRKHVEEWRSRSKGKGKMPDGLRGRVETSRNLRERLPAIRSQERELMNALGEARSAFYGGAPYGIHKPVHPPKPPAAGSGTFEENLIEVQGRHWPGQHERLATLPAQRVAGSFGGAIWDTQSTIEELGLKVAQAKAGLGGSAPDGNEDSERASVLEKLWREANLRSAVDRFQGKAMEDWDRMRQGLSGSFAGMFAKGGTIPAGMWGIAGERGPEPVVGPARVFSNQDGQQMFGQHGDVEILVNVNGGIVPKSDLSDEVLEILVRDPRTKDLIRREVLGTGSVGVATPGDWV